MKYRFVLSPPQLSARISSLPIVVSANVLDTDILPIVTGIAANLGVTKRISVSELRLKLGTTAPAGGRTVTSAATYLENNAVYNVKDFGAFGDGTIDDRAAIQLAINTAPSGSIVFFPPGLYRVTKGAGNECLLVTKNLNFISNQTRGATIRADIGGGDTTTDIIRFRVTDNSGLGDVRNQTIKGLRLFFNGGGRHAIHLDTGGLPQNLFSILDNDLNGNAGNAVYCAGSGYAYTTILRNQIVEGIKFNTNSSDGQRIMFNTISGNKCGVVLDMEVGTFSHLVMSNVIVSRDGAIDVINGSQVKIRDNQLEQIGVNAATYNSMVVVEGTVYPSVSVEITGNNFGGGTNVNSNIVCLNCTDSLVATNNFNDTPGYDVDFRAGAADNNVLQNTKRGSGSRDLAISDVGSRNNIGAADTGQVRFPVNQNASANPNILDDYEEGPITPTILFGGASVGVVYSAQVGSYTKIGNRVFFNLYVALSNKGSSAGNITVGGLPFSTNGTTNRYGSAIAVSPVTTGVTGIVTVQIPPGSLVLNINAQNNGAESALTNAHATNSTQFIISGHFDV